MKIGILTFHIAHNYGAVLQAYALQEFLKGKGHDVEIIDYRPYYLVNSYKPFRVPSLKKNGILIFVRSFIGQLLMFPKKKARYKKFNHFINNKLNLSKEKYNTGETPRQLYDVYVWGSDQIWNPEITKGYDPIFCGDFKINMNAKKVAYAASTEGKDIDSIDMSYLAKCLQTFDYISVRELDLAKRLSIELKKEIPEVLDPTLLVPSEIFDRIVSVPHNNTKPYLLIYQVKINNNAGNIAKQIASINQLDTKILDAFFYRYNMHSEVMTSSPEEFLRLVKNASFIITTSFHGVAFSLIFKKQFICVLNENNGNSRIKSLLNKLNLEDRIYTSGRKIIFPLKDIDYRVVDRLLAGEKEKSFSFISHALK